MNDATTEAAASESSSLIGGDAPADAAAQSAAPAADATASAEAKPGESQEQAGKPSDAKPEDKPTGAPEKYEDFKLPDTLKADEALMGEFGSLAKELNLPQEAAQKLVDLAGKMQSGTLEGVQAAIAAQAEKWADDSRGDKEYGGDSFAENLALGKKALDQFGTPELKTLLNDSKLGNHPEVLRFFIRAGKAISQDGFVPGRQGGARKSDAEVLYTH